MAEPWVAPDTQAMTVPAAAPVPPGPAVGARPPSAAHGGAPSVALPVPLRPLTIMDILDGGLRAWKVAPGAMAAIAAVFIVPTEVLIGVLTRNAVEDFGIGETFTDAFSATGPDDVETGFEWDLFFLMLAVQGIAFAFVTAAVARLVTGWYTGTVHRFGQLVGGALRRTWALVAAWVVVHVVEGVFAIALVVPLIVPMAWYAVVTPVVACEGVGPWRAVARSYQLCKRRFGTVLAVCLLSAAVHEALNASLTSIGALYLELDLPAGWAVNTTVAAASLLVSTPFMAAVVTLLYLDLRVRTEGLDIELAAARRFA